MILPYHYLLLIVLIVNVKFQTDNLELSYLNILQLIENINDSIRVFPLVL